jgi:hypothetical protein
METKMGMDILFLCKLNKNFQKRTGSKRGSGLSNSVNLTADRLNDSGFKAEVIDIDDEKTIEAIIKEKNPKKVVFEALWVKEITVQRLTSIFKEVKFYCHLHSQMPFLSIESNAMFMCKVYAKFGVGVIANSIESYKSFKCFMPEDMVFGLYNIYGKPLKEAKLIKKEKFNIDIACFGAIRPMKNQLIQAMAAYKFCQVEGKKLRFHINSARVESGGQSVLQNLINFFSDLPMAELIHRGWIEPERFVDEIADSIDIGMQFSMTETFNIVACDYTAAGIPAIGSDAIRWIDPSCKFSMHDPDDMIKGLKYAYDWAPNIVELNQAALKKHCDDALDGWIKFMEA